MTQKPALPSRNHRASQSAAVAEIRARFRAAAKGETPCTWGRSPAFRDLEARLQQRKATQGVERREAPKEGS
jgi:hypothetical protein